jgi:hypothetical protein
MSKKLKFSILCLLLALLMGAIGYFVYSGYGGYITTTIFYLFLAWCCLAFFSNKLVKINAILIVLLLFAAETYLRINEKGILDYNELNGKSVFDYYISPFKHFNYKENYAAQPNSEVSIIKNEFTYVHQYNELGHREEPIDSFKNKEVMLLLGDSFSEGVGVSSDSTPSNILEEFVSNYKFYNAGLSGSDIFQDYKKLEQLLPILKPKLVLLQLNSSDVAEVYYRGGADRFEKRNKKTNFPLWEIPYSFSYLFRLLGQNVLDINPSIWADNESSKAHTLNSLKLIYGEILHINNFCKKNNTQLLLILNATANELINNFSIYDVYDKNLVKNGIPHFYIYKSNQEKKIISKENIGEYFYTYDQHYKAKGYRTFAYFVVDYLSKPATDTLKN